MLEFQKSVKFPAKIRGVQMAGGVFCYEVSGHDTSGKDTSEHPFDGPKHIRPHYAYIIFNRKSKIAKNVIFGYFWYHFAYKAYLSLIFKEINVYWKWTVERTWGAIVTFLGDAGRWNEHIGVLSINKDHSPATFRPYTIVTNMLFFEENLDFLNIERFLTILF